MTRWKAFRLAQKTYVLGPSFWLPVLLTGACLFGAGYTAHTLYDRVNEGAPQYQVFSLLVIDGMLLVSAVLIGCYKMLETLHKILELGIAVGRLETDPAQDSDVVKCHTLWLEKKPLGLLLRHKLGLPVDPNKVPKRTGKKPAFA